MEAIGVTDDAGQKLAVLRAIDKLDKFGIEGVAAAVGLGRPQGRVRRLHQGCGLDAGQTQNGSRLRLDRQERWATRADFLERRNPRRFSVRRCGLS
jgi:hypothetical protein